MWVLKTVTEGVPEQTFRILPGTHRTMGRASGADFIVDAALVSRVHTAFWSPSSGGYPRPMNGIFVAITVMNCTLASSGRLAI